MPFDHAPTLTTERLVLRSHQLSDFDAMRAMWGDPEVVRHISGVPSKPQETWDRLLGYRGHWALLGYGYWAVETRDGGHFVGEVGLADFHRVLQPPQNGVPEAGWVLSPAHHGKGYGREAVQIMLAWADDHLGAETSFCMISPSHDASVALARHVGYGRATPGQYKGEEVLLFFRPRTKRGAA